MDYDGLMLKTGDLKGVMRRKPVGVMQIRHVQAGLEYGNGESAQLSPDESVKGLLCGPRY